MTFDTDKSKNRWRYSMMSTDWDFLYQTFEKKVPEMPAGLAILSGAGSDGVREITYRELNESIERMAERLKQAGVKSGDIVGTAADVSIETVITLLGIIKAGGVFRPIDAEDSESRISARLEELGASMWVTETGEIQKLHFDPSLNPRTIKVKPLATSPRPQITDLDHLSIPDRSLVDYEKYSQYIGEVMVKNCITMQATRGCPYKCAYCCKIWPGRFVTRSAQNIFEEIQSYYNIGIRRFAFYDDIFNLDVENSSRFFRLIIQKGLQVQLFFPVGFRGDILTKEYIDLVVAAGTINIALALETASPRIQELIQKKLNIEKLRENLKYLCETYPQVITELETIHGFPSETEEEAGMTLDFVKSIKWVHFPYVHILKIHSNTAMEQIALEKGINREDIERSRSLAYHELSETLPFDKNFTKAYQAKFLNGYFLLKERLLQVLPYQLKVLTKDEIVQKYNSYLPTDIKSIEDLLEFVGISEEELGIRGYLDEDYMKVPNLNEKMEKIHGKKVYAENPLNILLLDLSQFFTDQSDIVFDVVEPPLGLICLLTYLYRHCGGEVRGKIAKSRIDFDNYLGLKRLIEEFKPDLIGMRTLTYYKDFFHKTIALIRQWGITVPIVGGGPYATADYAAVLQDSNIDLVVLGEGEITFCQLIREIMKNNRNLPCEEVLKEIPGLAFIPESEKTRGKFPGDTGKWMEMLEHILKEIAEGKQVILSEIARLSEDEKKQIFEFNIGEKEDNYDF